MDLAFADRGATRNRRPHSVRLRVHVMPRGRLAEGDGLLDAQEVEGDGGRKVELDPRARRTLAGRPERVDVAVDRHGRRIARQAPEDGVRGRGLCLCEVRVVDGAERVAELAYFGDVGVGEKPLRVGRDAEAKKAVSPDRIVVEANHLAQRLELGVFGGVPEPSGANRVNRFGRVPYGHLAARTGNPL